MFDSTSNDEFSEALDAFSTDEVERPVAVDSATSEPIIAFSHVGISFGGRAVLEDLSFQMTASVIDNNDPLRYEKSMLNDWLHNQFKHSKKSAASQSSNS